MTLSDQALGQATERESGDPTVEVPAVRPARIRQVTAYAELSRQVHQAGLMNRRYAWYWSRMIAAALAFVLIWVAFFLLGDSWLQIGLAALLAVVVAQFGFLGHD